MTSMPPELIAARERFMEIVAELRPDLHRYCTRLVGSAIDGEDVVQETLAKAQHGDRFSQALRSTLRRAGGRRGRSGRK
jgi:DNA-directed RNA polymerase specialized sigma24 family protein